MPRKGGIGKKGRRTYREREGREAYASWGIWVTRRLGSAAASPASEEKFPPRNAERKKEKGYTLFWVVDVLK